MPKYSCSLVPVLLRALEYTPVESVWREVWKCAENLMLTQCDKSWLLALKHPQQPDSLKLYLILLGGLDGLEIKEKLMKELIQPHVPSSIAAVVMMKLKRMPELCGAKDMKVLDKFLTCVDLNLQQQASELSALIRLYGRDRRETRDKDSGDENDALSSSTTAAPVSSWTDTSGYVKDEKRIWKLNCLKDNGIIASRFGIKIRFRREIRGCQAYIYFEAINETSECMIIEKRAPVVREDLSFIVEESVLQPQMIDPQQSLRWKSRITHHSLATAPITAKILISPQTMKEPMAFVFPYPLCCFSFIEPPRSGLHVEDIESEFHSLMRGGGEEKGYTGKLNEVFAEEATIEDFCRSGLRCFVVPRKTSTGSRIWAAGRLHSQGNDGLHVLLCLDLGQRRRMRLIVATFDDEISKLLQTVIASILFV